MREGAGAWEPDANGTLTLTLSPLSQGEGGLKRGKDSTEGEGTEHS